MFLLCTVCGTVGSVIATMSGVAPASGLREGCEWLGVDEVDGLGHVLIFLYMHYGLDFPTNVCRIPRLSNLFALSTSTPQLQLGLASDDGIVNFRCQGYVLARI